LGVDVADTSGTLTSETVVQLLDTTGKGGICDLVKLVPGSDSGSYKCTTTGLVPPLLLMMQPSNSNPPLYGVSETGLGTANINPITDFGIEELYLGLGTSASLQWSSVSPLPITPPIFGSSLGLLDRTFAQPMVAYKFSPQVALTYDYYETKPTKGFLQMLQQFTFDGIGGTSTDTAQITLPGSVNFSASITPLPSVSGSSSHWTVQASTGKSYFYEFASYPIVSDAPSIYSAVGGYYTNFFNILKHEGAKLDAPNLLSIYSPSYFNDGNNASIQSELDATRLRQLKISQFSVGTIASLRDGVPDPGSSIIDVDVTRFATDHGVLCTDECCVSLLCTSEGCLDNGNQRIARLALGFVDSTVSSGGSPTNFTYLNATGSTPTGTLSGLSIDDLSGIYSSATIPFLGTRDINVKPFHTGPISQLQYDDYGLHTDFTAPIPSTDRFTFTPIPTFGTTAESRLFPPASSSEPFNLVSGPQALGDILGKNVKLEWKLPLTILVNGQSVSGDECTADQAQKVSSKPLVISPSATTASLKFDQALGGEPITGVDYRIEERSFGGLNLQYHFSLGTSCSF